jgi:hypothetical protein
MQNINEVQGSGMQIDQILLVCIRIQIRIIVNTDF